MPKCDRAHAVVLECLDHDVLKFNFLARQSHTTNSPQQCESKKDVRRKRTLGGRLGTTVPQRSVNRAARAYMERMRSSV